MGNPFPDLDGKARFKKPSGGLKPPPPECGKPLSAGYMVQDLTEDMPSSSPSCEVKEKGNQLQDVGRRVAIIRGADDNR